MSRFYKNSSSQAKKGNEFQSPECSTVIEVNPSCESEQSMLQKIIFPERRGLQSNYFQKEIKIKGLRELNLNISQQRKHIEKKYYLRKQSILQNEFQESQNPKFMNNQGISKQIKPDTLQSINNKRIVQSLHKPKIISEKQNLSPCMKLNFLSQSSRSKKLTYNGRDFEFAKQHQMINSQSKNQSTELSTNNLQSFVDEQKLQKIQDKIKKYQRQKYQTEQLAQRPISSVYNYDIKKQNKKNDCSLCPINVKNCHQLQITKSSNQQNRSQLQRQKILNQQNITQKSIHSKHQTSELKISKNSSTNYEINQITNFLQRIYSLILITPGLPLSPQNINLGNLAIEQLKLILGPLFAEVTIRQKKISLHQFLHKSLQILQAYKPNQLTQIFNYLLGQASAHKKPASKFNDLATGQQKKFQNINYDDKKYRKPGQLLRNSKADTLIPNYAFQRIPANQQKIYFSAQKQPSFFLSNLNSSSGVDYTSQIFQKKTSNIKSIQVKQSKNYQNGKYEFKKQKGFIDKNAYQLTPEDQKIQKKQINIQKRKKNKPQDDELERLNNLQKRFNEHFSSRQ